MLRPALALLVATAMLGLVVPVVDEARVSHSDSQVRTELDRIQTTASDLRATSDPVASGRPGARTQTTVRLPTRNWGQAAVERVSIPAHPNGSIRWRVTGGRTHSIEATPPLVAPPDGLVLQEGGRHRVRLSLQRRNGTTVVVVSRAEI